MMRTWEWSEFFVFMGFVLWLGTCGAEAYFDQQTLQECLSRHAAAECERFR